MIKKKKIINRIQVTQPSECGSIAEDEEDSFADEDPEIDADIQPSIPIGPRPRRLSEFNLKEKKQEMPDTTSFFVFSARNRFND